MDETNVKNSETTQAPDATEGQDAATPEAPDATENTDSTPDPAEDEQADEETPDDEPVPGIDDLEEPPAVSEGARRAAIQDNMARNAQASTARKQALKSGEPVAPKTSAANAAPSPEEGLESAD